MTDNHHIQGYTAPAGTRQTAHFLKKSAISRRIHRQDPPHRLPWTC